MEKELERPDSLYLALLEHWNEMHPEGTKIPADLQKLIEQYINYSRVLGAEIVIHKLLNIFRVKVLASYVSRTWVVETIQTCIPDDVLEIRKPEKLIYEKRKI